MRTNQNTLVAFGKYQNDMWNHVAKIDPAYILWAENTRPDVHFSRHFLDAAKIELVNEWNNYGGDGQCFNR